MRSEVIFRKPFWMLCGKRMGTWRAAGSKSKWAVGMGRGAFGVCFEVEDITPAMGCRGEGTPYSTEDREGRQGSGK